MKPFRVLMTGVAALLMAVAVEAEPTKKVLYLYGSVAADGTIPAPAGQAFHQMRLNDTGSRGMSQFKATIEGGPLIQASGVEFEIAEAYDAATTLDAATLGQYDVVILGSNNKMFSAAERDAVGQWVRDGGGLIAWSDSAFGGDFRQVGVGNPVGRDSNNTITTQFGMFFLRDNGAGNYAIKQYEFDHFLNDHDRDEGVVFRGEGVSVVRVSGEAKLLAKLQDGGLGGQIRLHNDDQNDPAIGPLNEQTDAALAIAQIDRGRVIGTFDRNTFWNAGEGTRLSHVDNAEYAQRLVLWASGVADPIPEPTTAALLGLGGAAALSRRAPRR